MDSQAHDNYVARTVVIRFQNFQPENIDWILHFQPEWVLLNLTREGILCFSHFCSNIIIEFAAPGSAVTECSYLYVAIVKLTRKKKIGNAASNLFDWDSYLKKFRRNLILEYFCFCFIYIFSLSFPVSLKLLIKRIFKHHSMIWHLLNLNKSYIYFKELTLEVIFHLKNKHQKYIKHFFHLWLGIHAYRIKHSRVWYYDVHWGLCCYLFCVDGWELTRICSFWKMILSIIYYYK